MTTSIQHLQQMGMWGPLTTKGKKQNNRFDLFGEDLIW